jgi:hypothetical protein
MADFFQSRALPEFCAAVVNRHDSAWPPTEDQFARDFLAHFGIARLAHYEGIIKWCGEVGVQFSTAELPHDMRGFNYWHEDTFSITMPINGGCFISREHTLFHELRELLEHSFRHLERPTASGNALESRAEQFAACVRIAICLEASKDFFEMARGVRDPLTRLLAYGLAGAATGVLVLGSIGVRQLEAQFDAQQLAGPT